MGTRTSTGLGWSAQPAAWPTRRQAVPTQRRRTCEHAAGPGIQQCRHLSLLVGRLAGMSQIDAGEQRLPRPAAADAVVHDPLGHAAFEGLRAGDHAVLAGR